MWNFAKEYPFFFTIIVLLVLITIDSVVANICKLLSN
ncbi:hypothetical protein ICK_06460 [Bacillus cereus BAG1X2-2]|nr:hypothetical protein ICK_06460 [Bacillus cereus BAG1X2-2]EOP00398.1 hypothetical protein ICO_06354 [Bacillus cereus BAG2O-1]